MRLLRVAEFDAEAPVVRIEAPDLGENPAEPRELHGRRLGERLRGHERRGLEFTGQSEHVVKCAVNPRSRRAVQLGPHRQRFEDRRAEVLVERNLGGARDRLRELLEAGVRVDAAAAGWRDRRLALERQPRSVREEVTDRRALGPGRLVEVEHALLRRDQRRQRSGRLRHGRPTELAIGLAVPGHQLSGPQDAHRRGARAPPLDLPQRLHAARY